MSVRSEPQEILPDDRAWGFAFLGSKVDQCHPRFDIPEVVRVSAPHLGNRPTTGIRDPQHRIGWAANMIEHRRIDFQPDSIGVLTRPIEISDWEARVRMRFAFLADLDADEQRWAACDERHRIEVQNALAALLP